MAPDIRIDDLRDASLLAEDIGIPFFVGRDHCITRVGKSGQMLGGVIFSEFTGASVCIHVHGYTGNWISKDMLWVTFHYPFEQLGVNMLLGKIDSSNTHALTFNRKLGFKEVARVPGVYPTGALVIMSMCRPDCRWLALRPKILRTGLHGQEVESTAGA